VLEESGNNQLLIELVCSRAREAATQFAAGLAVSVLLAGYDAQVLYCA